MRRPEPGQAGLTDLLEGRTIAIKPQDFDLTHRRGRQGEHRLSADAHKWQPYGIGDGVNQLSMNSGDETQTVEESGKDACSEGDSPLALSEGPDTTRQRI